MEVVEIIVAGRVQGVGFRFFTCEIARKLGVCGTVTNLPNGQVRITAAAEADVLHVFREHLRKGPPFSQIEDLSERRLPGDGLAWTGFRVC